MRTRLTVTTVLKETVARFIRDDRGNAIAEYSLVAGIFFMAVVGGLSAVQTQASSQLVGTQSRLASTAVSLPSPGP
jgi:Flp pilus assembly pilin Flp